MSWPVSDSDLMINYEPKPHKYHKGINGLSKTLIFFGGGRDICYTA